MSKPCKLTDCNNPRRSADWCGKHYARYKAHGDPAYVRPLVCPQGHPQVRNARGLRKCPECARVTRARYEARNRKARTLRNTRRDAVPHWVPCPDCGRVVRVTAQVIRRRGAPGCGNGHARLRSWGKRPGPPRQPCGVCGEYTRRPWCGPAHRYHLDPALKARTKAESMARYTERGLWGHEAVAILQDWRCAYCDREAREDGEADHAPVAWSRGGSSDLDNLVWACRKCNRSKRDRTVEEWLAAGLHAS